MEYRKEKKRHPMISGEDNRDSVCVCVTSIPLKLLSVVVLKMAYICRANLRFLVLWDNH